MTYKHQCSLSLFFASKNKRKILYFIIFFIHVSRVVAFTSSRFLRILWSRTFPVFLNHVTGLLGDHVYRCIRVTSDYSRHHTGVYDSETIDPVHPQPVIHHSRIPPSAHSARARVVTQSRRHVTRDTSPVCVALKSDVLASRKWYRQHRSVEMLERLRGSYFNRLW